MNFKNKTNKVGASLMLLAMFAQVFTPLVYNASELNSKSKQSEISEKETTSDINNSSEVSNGSEITDSSEVTETSEIAESSDVSEAQTEEASQVSENSELKTTEKSEVNKVSKAQISKSEGYVPIDDSFARLDSLKGFLNGYDRFSVSNGRIISGDVRVPNVTTDGHPSWEFHISSPIIIEYDLMNAGLPTKMKIRLTVDNFVNDATYMGTIDQYATIMKDDLYLQISRSIQSANWRLDWYDADTGASRPLQILMYAQDIDGFQTMSIADTNKSHYAFTKDTTETYKVDSKYMNVKSSSTYDVLPHGSDDNYNFIYKNDTSDLTSIEGIWQRQYGRNAGALTYLDFYFRPPSTVINKEVRDENGDGEAQKGENLQYTVKVKNDSPYYDISNVSVRDSMLEQIADGSIDYLEFNDDLTVDGSNYTGSLSDANLVLEKVKQGETVTLTYSVKVVNLPEGKDSIDNVVTDNGENPDGLCDSTTSTDDCDGTETPVEPPKTIITKSVSDANGDGAAQKGEKLTYQINVQNPDPDRAIANVPVRDSLLEKIGDGSIDYLKYNYDFKAEGSTFTGNLRTADLVLDSVPKNSTVVLTYSVTVLSIPKGVTTIDNVATDTTNNPDGLCDSTTATDDCDGTETPVNPSTIIVKSVEDTIDNDGYAVEGEALNYTIAVTNPNEDLAAKDVAVRDSVLENIADYPYLSWDGNVTIEPESTTYSGNIADGNLVFDSIPAKGTVTISYTLTMGDEIPDNISEILNIATDNGELPEICPPGDEDCSEVVVPINPDTIIKKSVVDASGDGLAQAGEQLNYQIAVTNKNTEVDAINVAVRDSVLENIADYPYITWDGNITIDPESTTFSGDIADGNLVLDSVPANSTVTISYTLTMGDEIPDNIGELLNIATDNGELPEICPPGDKDCSEVVVPVDPDTIINKSVVDASGDGLAQPGEALNYKIEITNKNKEVAAQNVAVRDSVLENIADYPYLTWDGKVVIDPESTTYSGDIADGSLVLDSVPADSTVTISYTLIMGDKLPDDLSEVLNIATDNGELPEICPPGDEDCSEVVVPVDPDTIIKKSVVDASGDGLVQAGEELSYKIEVTNQNTEVDAINVAVRDSVLENIADYPYLTWDGKITIDPESAKTSGNIADGDLVFDSIPADSTVTISYTLTMGDVIPNNISKLLNIATDNGELPEICPPGDEDCSEVVVPVDPDTIIDKAVVDENKNGVAEPGETLTYTIKVTNENKYVDTQKVAVRDSILENLDKYPYLTWDKKVKVNPDDAKYSGNLADGTFVLDSVPADSSVEIVYNLKLATSLPVELEEILNVVTDNKQNPVDPETELPIVCEKDSRDCADAEILTEGLAKIEKTLTDENGNGTAEVGENLNYELKVTNLSSKASAISVPVRDSILENLSDYNYVSWDGKFNVDPSSISYKGSLKDGSFIIDEIPASGSVTISYTLKVLSDPKNVDEIMNVVTNDGVDPINPDTKLPIVCEKDSLTCDSASIELSEKPAKAGIIAITGSNIVILIIAAIFGLIALIKIKKVNKQS